MKILLFADSHYCQVEAIGSRRPARSLQLISQMVEEANAAKVDFAVCLGDLTNAEAGEDEVNRANLTAAGRALSRLRAPVYCTFGNHDTEAFSVEELVELSYLIPAPCSFEKGGKTFLLLDACFHSDGLAYQKGTNEWRDAFLPPRQMGFLQRTLEAAPGPVYLFLHQNTDDAGREGDPHLISNAAALRALLERSGKVAGVFQGHYHRGFFQRTGSIFYNTLPAMCEADNPIPYQIIEL